jgi:hypothetical protein
MKIKRFLQKTGWTMLVLFFLTGCEMLKGFGEGLGNAFKQFKMP